MESVLHQHLMVEGHRGLLLAAECSCFVRHKRTCLQHCSFKLTILNLPLGMECGSYQGAIVPPFMHCVSVACGHSYIIVASLVCFPR